MYTIQDLYDLDHTLAKDYLSQFTYPWEALKGIKDMILKLGESLSKDEYNEVKPHVWVHKSATVFDSAYLGEPCIIGPNTEVRQCAFIRGSALVGADCVVGNSTELKNVILFDHVQTPHYNYVGDSILGYFSHTGAGAITSNVKSDKKNIVVKNGDEHIETGLKKMGAKISYNRCKHTFYYDNRFNLDMEIKVSFLGKHEMNILGSGYLCSVRFPCTEQ